jgi:putative transposase
MREWQSQAHVVHYCRYHVVFVAKYRKKSIYGTLRKDIGGILRELCRQQSIELVKGYAIKDHIHIRSSSSTLQAEASWFDGRSRAHSKFSSQKM